MKIANAAMPYGVLLSEDNLPSFIKIKGNMAGILEDASFEAKSVILKENDRLLFFSDGVTDNFSEYDVAEKWAELRSKDLNTALDEMMFYFMTHNQNIKDDILIVGIDQD